MERRRSRLSRRQFVLGGSAAGLGLVAGCGRLPGQAQERAKVYRVGHLVSSVSATAPDAVALRDGLAELGYVEGHNLIIAFRSAEGRSEPLPALAAELVGIPVDVVVTGGPPATHAARDATSTIPIVMVYSGDPILRGLVASLSRPGGNVTGSIGFGAHLAGKRLELLKATVPSISRVAVLTASLASDTPELQETQSAGEALGLKLAFLEVRDLADLDRAFEAAASGGADAIFPLTSNVLLSAPARVADLARESRLPAMHPFRDFVDAGGLMSYASSRPAQHRRAAAFVDKILKGAKPADLPVELPMTFDFVVNLKTAQALGLTFPNEIMLQVTEVLQ